jgi:hypothetical protein
MAKVTKKPVYVETAYTYVLELDEAEAKVVTALCGKLTGYRTDNKNKAASVRVYQALSDICTGFYSVYDSLKIVDNYDKEIPNSRMKFIS